MGTRSSKLYKDSPRTEHDEEGKVRVVKPSDKEAQGAMGDGEPKHDAQGSKDGVPAPARHMMERMEMHSKHEREHHTHDHGEHGEKKEMHKRHEKEHADMHKRHDKELTAGADSTRLKPEPEKGDEGESGKKKGEEKGSAKEKTKKD